MCQQPLIYVLSFTCPVCMGTWYILPTSTVAPYLNLKSFSLHKVLCFHEILCLFQVQEKLSCLRLKMKIRDAIRAWYLRCCRQDNTGNANTVRLLMVMLLLIQCLGHSKWLKEWNQAYEEHSKLSRKFFLTVRSDTGNTSFFFVIREDKWIFYH